MNTSISRKKIGENARRSREILEQMKQESVVLEVPTLNGIGHSGVKIAYHPIRGRYRVD